METLRDALSVLTPQFFDWLVLLVIVVGLLLAARRLRGTCAARALTRTPDPCRSETCWISR